MMNRDTAKSIKEQNDKFNAFSILIVQDRDLKKRCLIKHNCNMCDPVAYEYKPYLKIKGHNMLCGEVIPDFILWQCQLLEEI